MKTSWQDVMRNFAGIQTLTLNSTVKLFNILYKTFCWQKYVLRDFAGIQTLTLNLIVKLLKILRKKFSEHVQMY